MKSPSVWGETCSAHVHFCWPSECGAWVFPGSSHGRSLWSWPPPLSADPLSLERLASWSAPWLRVKTHTHTHTAVMSSSRCTCCENMWTNSFNNNQTSLTCFGRFLHFFSSIWERKLKCGVLEINTMNNKTNKQIKQWSPFHIAMISVQGIITEIYFLVLPLESFTLYKKHFLSSPFCKICNY